MKEKLILSVLVDNESGVLQRVASLFSRRNYNISSLTVSETEDPNFSRMTIETNTEPENFRQIKAQLLAFNMRYGARVLDMSLETITLEFTGTGETIDRFVDYLENHFGIVELARTGITSLARGEESFIEDV